MYVRAEGEGERLRENEIIFAFKNLWNNSLNNNFKAKERIFTHNFRSEALEIIFLSNMRLRAITAAPIGMRLPGDLLKLQEDICILMASYRTNGR